MKVIIIGGGIAGLSAGIYAQRCGFESEIHEKHIIPGGLCSYWSRQGYFIDNCVHWLTGTNPAREMHRVWEELDVLPKRLKVFQHQSFMQVELDGQSINLWQDLERLRHDMKILSPEDGAAIDDFIRTLDKYRSVVLSSIPDEQMSLGYVLSMLWEMRKVLIPHIRLAKMSIADYAARFRHPLLRKLLTVYLPDQFNAASMFYTYATFCDGNGGLPEGGSKGIVDRMTALYESLGGRIVTNHEASRIVVENGRAVAVEFKDGSSVSADWVVPACDTHEVLYRLLDGQFSVPYFDTRYRDTQRNRIYTTFNCYYGVECKAGDLMPQVTMAIEGGLDLLGTVKSEFLVKHFDYEEGFAPQGHSVLQAMVALYEDDYDRWIQLYRSDRKAYSEAKRAVGERMREHIEARFPGMKGKVRLIDVATPVTHNRYCNAYKGSYMSFIFGPNAPKKSHDGRIKGIDNLVLAGQWLQMPGGLPNAALTGKFAIDRIKKSI